MEKIKHRDPIRYARILRTASITGVSLRQVRRVADGDNENDVVLETLVRIKKAEEHLDGMLISEVNKPEPYNEAI